MRMLTSWFSAPVVPKHNAGPLAFAVHLSTCDAAGIGVELAENLLRI
jgi:hypothetical protein